MHQPSRRRSTLRTAVLLAIIALIPSGLIGGASTSLAAPTAAAFVDVDSSHVFSRQMTWLADSGISTGYATPDGEEFRPAQPVLREQMAAFLYRLVGSPEYAVVCPYTDVWWTHVFWDEICWLDHRGLSTGYDNGDGTRSFRPSQPVLREQMAAFLYRLDGSPPTSGDCAFTDVPASHVFRAAICWLAQSGISTGYADGTFRPSEPVLREQMAAFLYRYAEAGESPGVLTMVSEGANHDEYDTASPAYNQRSVSADGRLFVYSTSSDQMGREDLNEVHDVVLHDRQAGTHQLVSRTPAGSAGDRGAWRPTISAVGHHVAYESPSTTLVPDDTNGHPDVFVHDLRTGGTQRVSLSSSGEQGNGASGGASVSGDGRFVAFRSVATNLVPGDVNGQADIFVRDTLLGLTTRVSVSTAGDRSGTLSPEAPSISADGRYVTFSGLLETDPVTREEVHGVHVHDRQLRTTTLVSITPDGRPATYGGRAATVSSDGRFVSFISISPDLHDFKDLYYYQYAYVRDMRTGVTTMVSVSSSGARAAEGIGAAMISDDGRSVTFSSASTNLVRVNPVGLDGQPDGYEHVYVRDLASRRTRLVSDVPLTTGWEDRASSPTISPDGRYVAFGQTSSGPAGESADEVWIWDRGAG